MFKRSLRRRPYERRKAVFARVVGFVLVLSLCAGCVEQEPVREDTPFIYESEQTGLTVTFPEAWRDEVVVEESDDWEIRVFSKAVYESEAFPGGGLLFAVERMKGELVTQEDLDQGPVPMGLVGIGGGHAYVRRLPSDMQVPHEEEALTQAYQALRKAVDRVGFAFEAETELDPEGYKTVGGSFFTARIPGEWTVREEGLLHWGLYGNGTRAGSVTFVPYHENETVPEDPKPHRWVYLRDETIGRKALLTFDASEVDEATIQAVSDGFKFVGGPFTVVDLQSNAGAYLAQGGRKVFGTIDSFEMEGTRPVGIRVKVMDFITGEAAAEEPNGFRIEDLGRTETWGLEFGVRLMPLAPPDFNAPALYGMPLVEEAVAEGDPCLESGYFDFIIGADNQLKIILQRYVP